MIFGTDEPGEKKVTLVKLHGALCCCFQCSLKGVQTGKGIYGTTYYLLRESQDYTTADLMDILTRRDTSPDCLFIGISILWTFFGFLFPFGICMDKLHDIILGVHKRVSLYLSGLPIPKKKSNY